MIIILSPAKTFYNAEILEKNNTKIPLKTEKLLKILKKYSVAEIETNLNVSNKLANEIYQFYQSFNKKYFAIYLYGGTAFKYLNAKNISKEKLKKVYILSAFYGLVNGLDGISKYRLDIKDKIIEESLYNYWFDEINNKLSEFSKEIIINLSSGEYSKLLNLNNKNIFTINFGIIKNQKLTSSSMMLKKMRGSMANYILTNNLGSLKEIKETDIDGFKFNNELSTNNLLMFTKENI